MAKIIAAIILLVLGVFMAVCTSAMVRFQVWTQRVLMGAQYIPSRRTYMAMRIVGGILVILGLLVAVSG